MQRVADTFKSASAADSLLICRNWPVDAEFVPDAQVDSHASQSPVPASSRYQPIRRSTRQAISKRAHRMIHPLGEQIIIRTIKPDSVGSIIIPDSAKAITKTGESSLTNQLNFVEAEVIAVGPGKRQRGDATLLDDLVRKVDQLAMHNQGAVEGVQSLLDRAKRTTRIPMNVKPGDFIFFHPAVQQFDREIPPELIGLDPTKGKCYIIREDSILAVRNERSATQTDSAAA